MEVCWYYIFARPCGRHAARKGASVTHRKNRMDHVTTHYLRNTSDCVLPFLYAK
jgi:hypothetical protein